MLYILCMYYTGSSPEALYIVALYHISLDRFISEAVTVYTYVKYTLHVLYREWPEKTFILHYVYISFDRFMSGVVIILCQELAPGQLPVSSLSALGQLPNYHIYLYSNIVLFLV